MNSTTRTLFIGDAFAAALAAHAVAPAGAADGEKFYNVALTGGNGCPSHDCGGSCSITIDRRPRQIPRTPCFGDIRAVNRTS